MVSEGALRWALRPWLRRLVTRSISILPSIIIAGAVGREGLDKALNGSQVALSVALPFVSAPLIYFTSVERYMRVRPGLARFGGHYGSLEEEGVVVVSEEVGVAVEKGVWGRVKGWVTGGGWRRKGRASAGREHDREVVRMANNWFVTGFGVVVWLVITIMNVANLVLLGMGS